MEAVRMVLTSDLAQAEKLIALALITDVPVTGVGLSNKTITRHEKAARAFVEQLPTFVTTPARKGPPRESSAGALERWERFQSDDLRDSRLRRTPDVLGT
jgi:hypothetical protein